MLGLVMTGRAVVVLFAATALLVPASDAPDLQPDRAIAALGRADLQYLVSQITSRHPNPFHSISKVDFDREVADLSSRLPSLPPHVVAVELARIASLVGDGHTRLAMPTTGGFLPIEIEWLDGLWRVTRTSQDHRNLVGTRLIRLDATDIVEVARRVNRLVPAQESEGFSRFFSGRLMSNADVLDALGVLTLRGRVRVEGVTDAGERRSALVLAGPSLAPGDGIGAAATEPPSRQRDMRLASFSWRPLPGSPTAYVAFNQYLVRRPRGEFGALTREAFGRMDAAAMDRVVLDLRWNGGGDFTRGREFVLAEIRQRDRWMKPGALYVLIGRRTFSAAMVNAVDFKIAAGAILVGEPTGARPNSYSETGFFTLPGLGTQGSVSICRYDLWPRDVPGVPPDRLIPPTWADHRDGRDAALEWILAQPLPGTAAAPVRPKVTLTPPCRHD